MNCTDKMYEAFKSVAYANDENMTAAEAIRAGIEAAILAMYSFPPNYPETIASAGFQALEEMGYNAGRIDLTMDELGKLLTAMSAARGMFTSSPEYRAELYDEVFAAAQADGYNNVTDALLALGQYKTALRMLVVFAEQAAPNLPKMFGIDVANLNDGLILATKLGLKK